MVKHDNKWGTVCNDAFGSTEAQLACKTLGFSGGSYANGNIGIAESIVPIWMDDVDCDSSSTNFLECTHAGWGVEDCGHDEDILLTCT